MNTQQLQDFVKKSKPHLSPSLRWRVGGRNAWVRCSDIKLRGSLSGPPPYQSDCVCPPICLTATSGREHSLRGMRLYRERASKHSDAFVKAWRSLSFMNASESPRKRQITAGADQTSPKSPPHLRPHQWSRVELFHDHCGKIKALRNNATRTRLPANIKT